MVLGSGIRDPGSGKNLFRIPGSKKAPDPGSRIRIRNTDARWRLGVMDHLIALRRSPRTIGWRYGDVLRSSDSTTPKSLDHLIALSLSPWTIGWRWIIWWCITGMLSRLNKNIFWTKIARIFFLKFLSDIETKFFAAQKIAWHYIFVKKILWFLQNNRQAHSLGNYWYWLDSTLHIAPQGACYTMCTPASTGRRGTSS